MVEIILSAEQSALWEEGQQSGWLVEMDIFEDIAWRDITEQVDVYLDNGAVCFTIEASE